MAVTFRGCIACRMGRRMSNAKDVIASLNMKSTQILRDFDAQLFKAALTIETTAKDNIQGGGRSGRTYTRRSVSHQASSVGEYPKTDTGQLVRNIFSDRIGNYTYQIGSKGSGAPHGRYLEFGTLNMRPRPWLSRAVKDSALKIQSLLKGFIK